MHVNTRWQAFGVHLLISLAIFIGLLAIIVFYWFPGVFLHIGGIEGITIVAGVDFVIGPILTLAVYDIAKKSLKMDLSIIAAIQIACLSAGIWVVYHQRPIVQLITDEGLSVLTPANFSNYNIDTDALKDFKGRHPKLLILDLPKDESQRKQLKIVSGFVDAPLDYRFDLYRETESLSEADLKDRLEQFTLDEKSNCYWMLVTSPHYQDYACVDLRKGATKLSESI